jgi:hypothetical protein
MPIIGYRITLYSINLCPDGSFLASELGSATIPFTFEAVHEYFKLFLLMAIFHVGWIMPQLIVVLLLMLFAIFRMSWRNNVLWWKKLPWMSTFIRPSQKLWEIFFPFQLHFGTVWKTILRYSAPAVFNFLYHIILVNRPISRYPDGCLL